MSQRNTAIIYTRSSKDRGDGVSVAAQVRALKKLADDMGVQIVGKYSDVVQSGKDEHRPDFQRLLNDMADGARLFDMILIYDTSRLARNRFLAQRFKQDATKRGIKLVFATIPEGLDEVSHMMLESQFEVMDQAHSMFSKQKGMAGMAENVRKGFRAGGSAPMGYRLDYVDQGSVRDGKPVFKTKLAPSDEFLVVGQYLALRAQGVGRKRAMQLAGLAKATSTMNGVEHNALTYAGHTVWNMHREFKAKEGYVGGKAGSKKYRPREEWVIARNTHERAISDEQAEAILVMLEKASEKVVMVGKPNHLLVGLLVSPSGERFTGEAGKHYRTRVGRWLSMSAVDEAVVSHVLKDIQSPQFVRALLESSKKVDMPSHAGLDEMVKRERAMAGQLDRLLDVASNLEDPAPAYRKIDMIEKERASIAQALAKEEQKKQAAMAVHNIDEGDVMKMLKRIAHAIGKVDKAMLKDLMLELCNKILLDSNTGECKIHYRVKVGGRIDLASPRGCATNPALTYATSFRLAA